MSLWGDIKSAASSAYDNAESSVTGWWEDRESAPRSAASSAAAEASASGATATSVPNAQNNTGAVVGNTGTPMSYTPYFIGGGILVVVLLVVVLMLGRK
ncbi:hypothetical protein CBF23_003240 [Marinomonas agarivorans]|nr:hypothetical protein CBF23_003240 [Marinomonas agarivorans]